MKREATKRASFVTLAGAAFLVPAVLWLASCGASSAPHDLPCASDEFYYLDTMCAPGAGGTLDCERVGDRLCYQRCESDADCTSGYRCATIGLYANGAADCAQTVKVCADQQDTVCP